MISLAKSPLAPVLGQRIPLRGSAPLLFNSYARTRYQPEESVTRVTTQAGDINVRVSNAAASEQVGEMRLYRPSPQDTNRARASLIHHPYLTGPTTTVPVMTIDDVCAGAPVALIKIDVEGHEAAVVRGATDTIARHAPSIVFEYAPELLTDAVAQTPFCWLAERGYLLLRVRPARHGVTGRIRLVLDRLCELPGAGGDLLAVSPSVAGRLHGLLA